MAQEKGRSDILLDYHLRVGQLTRDSRVPAGQRIAEQRLDETEVGEGTTVTLIDARRPEPSGATADASAIARYLGLDTKAAGLTRWDVFDAVLTPGDVILLMTWKAKEDADASALSAMLPAGARLRHIRVIRDYGMFDRREAPQYYPAVEHH
jgi:hypothetical protein